MNLKTVADNCQWPLEERIYGPCFEVASRLPWPMGEVFRRVMRAPFAADKLWEAELAIKIFTECGVEMPADAISLARHLCRPYLRSMLEAMFGAKGSRDFSSLRACQLYFLDSLEKYLGIGEFKGAEPLGHMLASLGDLRAAIKDWLERPDDRQSLWPDELAVYPAGWDARPREAG